MTLDQSTIAELATMYLRAEHEAAPVPPWHERFPAVTEDDAYAIQSELIRLHLTNGATLAGWKAGATNPAAQSTFGLREAVYGQLLRQRRLSSGATLPMAGLIHPRVECEVAFLLACDLSGPGVTPEMALAAVQAYSPRLKSLMRAPRAGRQQCPK